MTEHKVGTREEWLAARLELLEAEKELTRRSDELARQRQQLPWVRIDKDYRFETEDGTVSLRDLFGGRSQLLVYHFMFPGCPSCSSMADGFDGFVVHLEHHDVAFTCVSRYPIDDLTAFKERMGWSFPWVSSQGSDFNFDFGVSFTDEQLRSGAEYNFRLYPAGDPDSLPNDFPGMSAFALQNGIVYHTYSAYARGGDVLWGMYQWLDRAPKGRNESGEQFSTPRWAWFRNLLTVGGNRKGVTHTTFGVSCVCQRPSTTREGSRHALQIGAYHNSIAREVGVPPGGECR